jgi:hypothetical protein
MAGNGRVMKLNRKSVISYNRSKRKKRLLDYRGYGLGTGEG